MKLDVITIFPQMVRALVAEGIIGRAIAEGILNVAVHDLRDYTDDRHRVVDDTPYGGGPGMVLKPEPIFRAVEAIRAGRGALDSLIVTSPQGRVFTQVEAARLAGLSHVAIVCGRYEGVDERVSEGLGAEELSIGDYVLSGGEPAALVIVDAVARLVPGVVGDPASIEDESFTRGLLHFPQVHAPGRVSRPQGARSAHVGSPRRHSGLAPAGGIEAHARTAAGLVERCPAGRRATRRARCVEGGADEGSRR